MATKTLLDIVQDILDSLDSDPVNSITDTEEALQIARIVISVYDEMVSNRMWPLHKTLDNLNSIGDNTRPTILSMPSDLIEVHWLKYNKRTATDTKDKFENVIYRTPEQFTDLCNGRASDATNVDVMNINGTGVALNIYNDQAPQYYTSFDDEFIVFDSYDSDVGNTIIAAFTQLFCTRQPVLAMTDAATPDLPPDAFAYLLAESLSTAAVRVAQIADEKAEQVSRRQRGWSSRKNWRVHGGIAYRNFGRKSLRPRDPTFKQDRN